MDIPEKKSLERKKFRKLRDQSSFRDKKNVVNNTPFFAIKWTKSRQK